MRYDKIFRDSGYLSTLLTSFEFDPIVFENVVLAGLTAGGARDITVVADTERVNAQFAEYGPPRQAGRYYHLAKRQVAGRFHPKIVLQAGEKKARLIVGSANLTGSGIMGNLEAIAMLDASESDPWAAPVLRAARAYLGGHISQADRAGRAALTRFDTRAPWLTDVAPHRTVEDPEGNRHGLLHEDADSSIADQLAAFINEDPIHRLILVSPFWNSALEAVSDLSDSLGGPMTSLVLNPGDHPIDPESLESTAFTIHDAADLPGGEARRLHAKMLIACGARADYTMTGSANMTRQALFSREGGPGNAEVCLVRAESPGTAIGRLGLSGCLERPLAIADHPPSSRESRTDTGTPAARDGGSLSMQLGFLTWTPPSGHATQGCQIMLQGPGNEPLATVIPEKKDERLVAEIEHLDPPPRRGCVIFTNGVVSAPVPIADVDRLARLGHDRLPAAQAKLLSELGDMRSFDGQALDLATRIRAMVDAEQNQRAGNRSRDTQRNRSRADEEDTTPMSREEFLGSDTEADVERAETAWRQSAMGEVRRQITAALGLGLESIEDDFETDESSGIDDADLSPSDERDRDEFAVEGEDESQVEVDQAGNAPAEDTPPDDPPPPPANQGQNPTPRSRSTANGKKRSVKPVSKLETKLAEHLAQMREEVRDETVDVLSLRNAMTLTMVTFATLNDAAPVGARPTHERPMPARGTPRSSGWITLLGGLLSTCRDRLPQSKVLENTLDKERVECLSALLFAVGLLADAAQKACMPDGVLQTYQLLHGDLGRIIHRATQDKPEVQAYLAKTLEGWENVHGKSRRRVPNTLSEPQGDTEPESK